MPQLKCSGDGSTKIDIIDDCTLGEGKDYNRCVCMCVYGVRFHVCMYVCNTKIDIIDDCTLGDGKDYNRCVCMCVYVFVCMNVCTLQT